MRYKIFSSGIAALMLLLVASMSFAPAVSAAEAIGSAGGSGSGCTSCWCGNTLNANVITVELTGAEKNKLVSEALKNEEVKKIRSKMLKLEFTPKINEVSVSIIKFETESGTQEVTGVKLPFQVDEDEAVIIYAIKDNQIQVTGIYESDYEDHTEVSILDVNESGEVNYKKWKIRHGSGCTTCNSDVDCVWYETCETLCTDWGLKCVANLCESGLCGFLAGLCASTKDPVTCLSALLVCGYYCRQNCCLEEQQCCVEEEDF